MDSPNDRELRTNLIKFRNLLKNNKNLTKGFLVNSKIKKKILYFTLQEKKAFRKRKYPRKIKLTISINPEFYSIKSFELNNIQKDKGSQNQIYSVKIEGDNDITEIVKNLMDLIRGKDKTIYHSNQPFSI